MAREAEAGLLLTQQFGPATAVAVVTGPTVALGQRFMEPGHGRQFCLQVLMTGETQLSPGSLRHERVA